MIKYIITINFFLMFTLCLTAQWSQVGNNVIGDFADDELSNQGGKGVALNSIGDVMIIGVRKANTAGTEAGKAKVYQLSSGVWSQIGEDIRGEAANDWFGESVDINAMGNIVAVGAPFNDANGSNSGHVRVYENISGTWTLMGNPILGTNIDDEFGRSVALSADGRTLVVGILKGGFNNAGHVKIYEYDSGFWTQLGNTLYGSTSGSWFGADVDINASGNKVIVGAPYDTTSNSGMIRVYENISGTWTQVGSDIYGLNTGDLFGYSVAIDDLGDRIVVGAIANNSSGTSLNSGHIRVFDESPSGWFQTAAFDGNANNDRFGIEVAISGNGEIIVVGASSSDLSGYPSSGIVRVFRNEVGVWQQLNPDIYGYGSYNYMGRSVSANENGHFIAVATPLGDLNGNNSGHVRVYNNSTLGIDEYSNERFVKLYPNPSENLINIKFLTYLFDITMCIYDQLGREVMNKTFDYSSEVTIKINHLKSGIYMLFLKSQDHSEVIKFIKK